MVRVDCEWLAASGRQKETYRVLPAFIFGALLYKVVVLIQEPVTASQLPLNWWFGLVVWGFEPNGQDSA